MMFSYFLYSQEMYAQEKPSGDPARGQVIRSYLFSLLF